MNPRNQINQKNQINQMNPMKVTRKSNLPRKSSNTKKVPLPSPNFKNNYEDPQALQPVRSMPPSNEISFTDPESVNENLPTANVIKMQLPNTPNSIILPQLTNKPNLKQSTKKNNTVRSSVLKALPLQGKRSTITQRNNNKRQIGNMPSVGQPTKIIPNQNVIGGRKKRNTRRRKSRNRN
jgi:hypothetical protein